MSSVEPRKPLGLLRVGLAFLILAVLETLMVAVASPRGSGANIGLPIALLAVLASGIAVGLAARARSLADASRSGAAVRAGCFLALLAAGAAMLFVGLGVLEELR